MPLEGWQTMRFGHVAREAIAARQGNRAPNIQNVINSIAQKQKSPAAAEAPPVVNQAGKINLPTQHVPKGWEAVDALPSWINHDSHGRFNKYKVDAAKLQHAIRIPGTDHVLTSDVKLTRAQLESLADDYKDAVDRIGHKFPQGVAMHVPTTRKRSARGWVRDVPGVRTFYMKPSLAKDADEKTYQIDLELDSKLSTKGDFHMPAVKKNGRRYTMLHEMGHLIDAQHDHTDSFGKAVRTGPEFQFWLSHFGGKSDVPSAGELSKMSFNQLVAPPAAKSANWGLSRYGRTNISEGYAEAAAQYFLGGKGSNSVADAYAQRYGW